MAVPVAMGTNRAATADAEPPELPPATRLRFQGLSVGPKYEVSVEDPIANSSILVLPIKIAPASSSLSTIVAL